MSPEIVLYDFLFSGNSYKVRLLLTQLQLAFECRSVDLLKGEGHAPVFLEKNPLGQVPVLQLGDGTYLRESNAILMHLAEGTSFLPTKKLSRTRVLEWLCFEQSNISPVIGRARFHRTFPDVMPVRPEDFAAWESRGKRALQILNDHLAKQPFLVDGRYTIADIGLYAYTHVAGEAGISLAPYSAL